MLQWHTYLWQTNYNVLNVWGWHLLRSHLSLLDNVVGVTAREAGTLQEVHDIILTATITDAIKEVITLIHRAVISFDYMDSWPTAILTSPSSCLRSTGPSLHQWHGEGRLPLCRSRGKEIYCWSRGESRTQQQQVMSHYYMAAWLQFYIQVKAILWLSERCKHPPFIIKIISTVCSRSGRHDNWWNYQLSAI